MQINKILTTQKAKESSSLKNQELLFIRRPDISASDRLVLAIQGSERCYRDCTIASLCEQYKVSHEFIYSLSRLLKKSKEAIFGIKLTDKTSDLSKVLQSIQFFIEGKLTTQGSNQGLSNLAKNWGGSYTSTNFLSQALEVTGSLLDNTLKNEVPRVLCILCDEVYSQGKAILVTLEAQSMAVLDIKILDKALNAADWEKRFELLQQNNVVIGELIKDQGVAMKCAANSLPDSTLILADVFHAIPKRLGVYHSQLNRKIEKALTAESEIEDQLTNAASEGMYNKQQAKLQAARAKTLGLLDLLDWFEQTYFSMLRQLRPFTSKGLPRCKHRAKDTIDFALDMLLLLPLTGIEKDVKHIRKLLQNGELLGFMDKIQPLYDYWEEQLCPDTLWLWMLYWLGWKKSFQTHSSKVQQQAKQQALAAQQLLKEYYDNTCFCFEQIKVQLFASLDTIVQASSLVETFNSILKPFINSARGQVSQPLLNLVQFYHNHRVFQARCKRGGKAPIEILTGQTLDKHWLELIMDKVMAAFQKYDTTSLKELHFLLCKNEKIKQKGLVKTLPKLTQSEEKIAAAA